MLRRLDEDWAARLLVALETEPSVSVRVNALKGVPLPADADTVPWWAGGFYLPERPLFAADPAWHQGLYYVQDASSMAYSRAVTSVVERYFATADHPLRYLDACAAPGGKTIAAIEALPPGSLVVANEYDRHRANILVENVVKAGSPAVVVSRGDAAAYAAMGPVFDIIAVDAPCSGEGMMRKEPEAVRQWSESLIDQCADMQTHITDALWSALRPGGVMIYSTCTFNRTEDEAAVERLIDRYGAESIPLGLDAYAGVQPGFGTGAYCYRFAPGYVRGEGLFIAAVRKPAEDTQPQGRRKAKGRSRTQAVSAPGAFAKQYVSAVENYVQATAPDGTVYLRPAAHSDFIAALSDTVDLIHPGLPIAVTRGRDMVPTHALALSTALSTAHIPAVELDYPTAMAYLRGESISSLPAGTPRGIVLATYAAHPLGWLKNIGARANNLYPELLRLRLDARRLPDTPPAIL